MPAVPGQTSVFKANRFPKSERLTKRREFLEVYRTGRKTYGGPFICFVLRRVGQGRKFGVAVPRQVGGAVIRNRVKRYLRETYRLNRQRLAEDAAIVIVARGGAGNLNYHECAEAVTRLFRKGNVLSE